MEVIPKTLALNCGVDVVKTITELRSRHVEEDGKYYGLEGISGKIIDMSKADVWEPVTVKT